jgi:hypothetical protein
MIFLIRNLYINLMVLPSVDTFFSVVEPQSAEITLRSQSLSTDYLSSINVNLALSRLYV